MNLPPQSYINATSNAYHAVTIALCEAARERLPSRLDIAYGDHPEQRLDLYFPEISPAPDAPIVLNIHGGGWTHGYKEWMGLNAPVITAFPAIYASLSYRLAPAAKHPSQLEDCLLALGWLYRHASSFSGDRTKIHVVGHSAGAHIAALATLRTDLHSRYGFPSGAIRSCFGFSGIYDLRGAHDRPVVTGISPVPMLDNRDDELDASPLLFARKVGTSFHLSWGTQDDPTFAQQGHAFAQALIACGNVVQTCEPDFDHFWIHLDQSRVDSEWNAALARRVIASGSAERS